jgi:hypothetical protein
MENLSTNDPWVKGEKYKVTYRKRWALLPVAPGTVDRIIEQTAMDPRLKILNWTWDGSKLVLELEAIENPIPIGIIVLAVIGVAGIYGLALALEGVAKVTHDVAGSPLGTGIGLWLAVGSAVTLLGAMRTLRR